MEKRSTGITHYSPHAHLTYLVAVGRTAALIYHRITTLYNAINGKPLVGIRRGIAKVGRVGNKIAVSVGAADYSQSLLSTPLNATLEGKTGRSGSGHAIVAAIRDAIEVPIPAPIQSTDGVRVRAAIKAIDDAVSVRVIISPFAVWTSRIT